jgi:hypothetical protein
MGAEIGGSLEHLDSVACLEGAPSPSGRVFFLSGSLEICFNGGCVHRSHVGVIGVDDGAVAISPFRRLNRRSR